MTKQALTDSTVAPDLDTSLEPSTIPYSPYPDKPLEVFSLEASLVNPSDPDGAPITVLQDRIFIELQTGGEKYLIHAQDGRGVANADVSQATFGPGFRERRLMTEVDVQTMREAVLAALPNEELESALNRPNGLREFLDID